MSDSSYCESQTGPSLFASIFSGWNQGKFRLTTDQIELLHQNLVSVQDDLADYGINSTEAELILSSAIPNRHRGFVDKTPEPVDNGWLQELLFSIVNQESKNHVYSMATINTSLPAKVNVKGQIGTSHAKDVNSKSESEVVLKELSFSRPLNSRFLNEVALGRQEFTEGLGLSLSGLRDGIVVYGNLDDKPLELGWFDGLHARITSPFLFGIPFSFYTRHKQNRLLGREYHSGLSFKHEIKRLGISGQLSEYTDKTMGRGTASRLQAYELSMALGSRLNTWVGHTKTGLDYRSGLRDAGIHFHLVLPKTRQVIAQKVISWGRNALLGELSGYQELQYGLQLNYSPRGNIEASVHHLLDNTKNSLRQNEEFLLGRLEWNHKFKNDLSLSTGAYWVDYLNQNQISNYLLMGKTMQDNLWLSTEIRVAF